jgi:hypothetical protein
LILAALRAKQLAGMAIGKANDGVLATLGEQPATAIGMLSALTGLPAQTPHLMPQCFGRHANPNKKGVPKPSTAPRTSAKR